MVRYRFKTDEKWYDIAGTAEQTLLQMSEAAGIRTPHACEEGGCGSCRGKLLEGNVKMMSNNVLDDDDLGGGFVLACQSKPTTPEVVIDFDAADH